MTKKNGNYSSPFTEEQIVLDSNQRNPLIEEIIEGYAHLAKATGYRHVTRVVTPGLHAEDHNRAMTPEVKTARDRYRATHGMERKIVYTPLRHVTHTTLNEADFDFLDHVREAFRKKLEREKVKPEDRERVQKIAFDLKRRLDPEHCPKSAEDISITDLTDDMVVMALYSVSGTSKFVNHYLQEIKVKFNSADYSVLAWYGDNLSRIMNDETHVKSRKTIFISNDREAVEHMEFEAANNHCLGMFENCMRRGFADYVQRELGPMMAHAMENGVTLGSDDLAVFDRLRINTEALLKRNEGMRMTQRYAAETRDSNGPSMA